MIDMFYIVKPAYNEKANIKNTIKLWYPVIQRLNKNDNSRIITFNNKIRYEF